jgi:YHS domain-containing protein
MLLSRLPPTDRLNQLFCQAADALRAPIQVFLRPQTINMKYSFLLLSTAGGAIRGYDPVAYFREGKAVRGDTSLHSTWNGATWYFSSRANQDAFNSNPAEFAPQYGGYCAYGMAAGHKAPTDPEAWKIENGKLYLNYNKQAQQAWLKHTDTLIIAANKNWQNIKEK